MGCIEIKCADRVLGKGGREEDGELALRPGSLLQSVFVGRDCNVGLFHSGINQSKMGLLWCSSSSPAIDTLALCTQGWQKAGTGSSAG